MRPIFVSHGFSALLVLLAGITTVSSAQAASEGCGTEYIDPLILNVGGNTQGGDIDRHYRVELPANGYDNTRPHPLVFVFHPMNSTQWESIGGGVRPNWAGDIPPIIVRPRSGTLDNPSGTLAWNLNLAYADVEFIESLKRHMTSNYCIDESQIYAYGTSSGGFGALGTGCYSNMSALVSGRAGIVHPSHAVTTFGFPLTAEPSDNACGPTPTLLGNARGDQAVPAEHYAEPTLDFFLANNECSLETTIDVEAQLEVCDEQDPDNCECLAYTGCTQELTVCSWDGNHSAHAIDDEDAAWFLSKPRSHGSTRPACRYESFESGQSHSEWRLKKEHPWFDIFVHEQRGSLHVSVPSFKDIASPHWVQPTYIRGAYARFFNKAWDVPLLKDFSVALTVTNLKRNYPEARLKLSSHTGVNAVEIRTDFNEDGQLVAQTYLEGMPKGSEWPIGRSGPGNTRLWEGACWMVQGDPVTDKVSVYSRNIQPDAWPRCGGDWILQADFSNPYTSSPYPFILQQGDEYYETGNLEIEIEVGRNTRQGHKRGGYARFDDIYAGRTGCRPESNSEQNMTNIVNLSLPR